MNFSIDGVEYRVLKTGVIQQLYPEIIRYDVQYIEDRYNISGMNKMASLRIDLVKKFLPGGRYLEVGYGSGHTISCAAQNGFETFGYDLVKGYLPEHSVFEPNWKKKKWNVACFFDVLEHMEDLNWLGSFDSEFVVISLPWCKFQEGGDFKGWKHRRVNEHLWHFNDESLIKTMISYGYKCVYKGNPEDGIRHDPSLTPNILTCVFERFNSRDHEGKELYDKLGLSIVSHGGVSTNYLMKKFQIEHSIYKIPHYSYLISEVPTIYLYGDFQNAISSQKTRGVFKFNMEVLRNVSMLPLDHDPLNIKRQIINYCDFSNVALLNYSNYDQRDIDAIVEKFDLGAPPEIEKWVRNTDVKNEYPEYEIDDRVFPSLAWGRTTRSESIKQTLLGAKPTVEAT